MLGIGLLEAQESSMRHRIDLGKPLSIALSVAAVWWSRGQSPMRADESRPSTGSVPKMPGNRDSVAVLIAELPGRAYQVGRPILVTCEIRNRSDKPVTIWLSGFWANHRVTVTRADGREPELTAEGRARRQAFNPDGGRDKNAPKTLQPGGAWRDDTRPDLAALYLLTPGHYRVIISYEDKHDPNPLRIDSVAVPFRVE